jgi:hypothetical protein
MQHAKRLDGGRILTDRDLVKDGAFYRVASAYPALSGYPYSRKLLGSRDDHATSATDKRNPFLSTDLTGQSQTVLPRAQTRSEGRLQRQQGPNSYDDGNIQQPGENDNPFASLRTILGMKPSDAAKAAEEPQI